MRYNNFTALMHLVKKTRKRIANINRHVCTLLLKFVFVFFLPTCDLFMLCFKRYRWPVLFPFELDLVSLISFFGSYLLHCL